MPITNKLLKPVVFHRLLTSSGLQVWPVMHKSGQTILLQITNLNTTQIVRAKEKTSTRVLETANNPVDMQLHYSITRWRTTILIIQDSQRELDISPRYILFLSHFLSIPISLILLAFFGINIFYLPFFNIFLPANPLTFFHFTSPHFSPFFFSFFRLSYCRNAFSQTQLSLPIIKTKIKLHVVHRSYGSNQQNLALPRQKKILVVQYWYFVTLHQETTLDNSLKMSSLRFLELVRSLLTSVRFIPTIVRPQLGQLYVMVHQSCTYWQLESCHFCCKH